jgi:hypothetical protein
MMAGGDWLTASEKVALIEAISKTDRDEMISFAVFYKDFVEHGRREALLEAVYSCSTLETPIYPWLKLALVFACKRGRDGEVRSWDELFGKPTRYGTGERLRRRFEQEALVIAEIERLKAEGKPLNEEEFAEIGRRLGVGGKSTVKDLQKSWRFYNDLANRLYSLS